MLFNIFIRRSLTDDFWGLHKNMNWATFFKNESYALVLTNPIQGEAGGHPPPPPPPIRTSPVTSTNVGISPQNFLTFRYNPFATLVKLRL